jgi:hypothetical protein
MTTTEAPGYLITARRDWAPLCTPEGALPGIEIRYVDIWGTGEDACVRVELRQMTP